MQRAAQEATVVVPVLRMDPQKEMIQLYNEWTQVLGQKIWADRIPLVLLTKAVLQKSAKRERNSRRMAVADITWNDSERAKDVLHCDSLIGMAAIQLEVALHEANLDTGSLAARLQTTEDPLNAVSVSR